MKESLSLRFLYHTAFGRLILKLLLHPFISKVAGLVLSSPLSKPFINGFMKKNGITLQNIDVPKNGFKSFNAFFTRKCNDVNFNLNPLAMCSPCDGFLSCYKIDKNSRFEIKHSTYSVAELLKDGELAREFENGVALIFRLTPANYHRYHYIDSGEITKAKTVKGVLHCVRPIAMEQYPVFIQNSREYICENTENFGKIVQMEIGALLVGKIKNHKSCGKVSRAEEKGYFMFGGSTIAVLVKENVLNLEDKAFPLVPNGTERPVKLGEQVATHL